MNIYGLKRAALSALYPNRCPFCGEIIGFDKYYCVSCAENFTYYEDNPRTYENLSGITSVFAYNDDIKSFIYEIKENANACAISAAAKLISERLPISGVGLITCIPASKARMRERGYNPPALIALELGRITGADCGVKLLYKTRETGTQKELSKAQRQESLQGVFAVRENKQALLKNMRILLIDDVRTTGATLSEAAGALLEAGTEEVVAATIAGTLDRKKD